MDITTIERARLDARVSPRVERHGDYQLRSSIYIYMYICMCVCMCVCVCMYVCMYVCRNAINVHASRVYARGLYVHGAN